MLFCDREPRETEKRLILQTMRISHIITGLLLLGIFAAGCREKVADAELLAADAVMNERPDSALQLLLKSDTTRYNPAERARRRLLLARACNRTGTMPVTDTLIGPALNYYERKGSDAEKALAWYYYGTAHQQAGALDEAVKGYSSALHYAENSAGDSLSDRLRAALYHTLGTLYTEQKYAAQAEDYFDRAARLFGELGRDEDRMYSLLMESMVLYQEHRYDEAIALLESIRGEAAASGNEHLRLFVDTYLIHYHTFADDWSFERLMEERKKIDRNALRALSRRHDTAEADSEPAQLYDILSAIVFCKAEMADSAACYVRRSLAGLGTLDAGTAGMLRIAASVVLMQGKIDSAYYYENRYGSMIDSIHKAERNQQVAELELRYRNQYEMSLIEARHRYQTWIFILFGLFLLAGAGWGITYFRRRLRRRDEQLDEYLALVESFRESQDSLTSRLRTTDERETAVKELLEGRFAIIREIAATYYLYGETRRLTEKMKELALSPAMLGDVVRMADLYNDHAVTRLRAQYPGWTERNYHFAALVIAGFSPQEISVMLGMTLNGVYTLKSKLKRRIAESDAADKAVFVRFFD